MIKSKLGLLIEDNIVLDNTPEARNGSTHKDFPINSNIIEMSSPSPPNPPNLGETRALIMPSSALSFQKFLQNPSGKFTFSLRLFIFW